MLHPSTVIGGRFELRELIAEGGMGEVYRALDRETGSDAAVKVLDSGTSRRAEGIIRYHAVLEVISQIAHPCIVRILGYDIVGGGDRQRWVATELVPGSDLHEYLNHSGPLSVMEALSLAIQVCTALAAVHERGIIHGDLKPGNILCPPRLSPGHGDAVRGSVKLIDFGLSRLRGFDREMDTGFVFGTFRYLSPEQCGILRVPVDERSDLYSLGIVLYEMLTGESPFGGESITEVLHRQAASVPGPPSQKNPAVPHILDRVIMKLLEKEPERRYGTASGLRHDLERVAAGETDFPIAQRDDVKLDFRAPLAGRAVEKGRLMEMADAARERRGGVALIAGEAGSGKTRLAEELRQYALKAGMAFIEGRCGGNEGGEPFGPFRDALAGYVRIWRGYSPARREAVRRHMGAACGSLGRIVIGFAVETRELLGECQELLSLESDRETYRFYITMARFFLELANAEGSLVVFLDDLHRADGGTLRLFSEMARQVREAPLLVLGACRSDDVSGDHSLRDLMMSDSFSVVTIGGLDEADVQEFVGGTISIEGPERDYLSAYVLKRGGGNPLFFMEVLKQAVREKALFRDGGRWALDRDRLRGLEAPESVIGALLERIERLPEHDRAVLSRAAVIGKSFDLDLLSALEGGDGIEHMGRLVAVIDRGRGERLIEEDTIESWRYAFAHDRVHEAFLERISADERKALHGCLGVILEEKNRDDHEAVVFDLAAHFIESENEVKIAEYCYAAGLRAMKEHAYENADSYFRRVRTIVEKKKDEASYRGRWIDLLEKHGETLAQLGISDVAIESFITLLPYIDNVKRKSHIYSMISRAALRSGDFDSCKYYAEMGLSLMGERLPVTKYEIIYKTGKEFIVNIFRAMVPFGIRKRRTGRDITSIIHLYEWLNWVSFFHDGWEWAFVSLRMLNLSERYLGVSRELGVSINYHVLLCSSFGFLNRSKKYLSQAQRIAECLGSDYVYAQYYSYASFYHFCLGDFREAARNGELSIALFTKIGDYIEILKAGLMLVISYFSLSEYELAYSRYMSAIKYSNTVFDEMAFHFAEYPSHYYVQSGQHEKAERLLKDLLDKEIRYHMNFMHYNSLLNYAYLLLEKGFFDQSIQYIERAISFKRNRIFPPHYEFAYFTHAMASISKYRMIHNDIDAGEKKRMIATIKYMCKKSLRTTAPWVHHRDVAYRVNAQYYGIIDSHRKAEKFYVKALESSRSMGKRYELARTLYEYGLYLKGRGRAAEAFDRLAGSFRIFNEIGVKMFNSRIAGALGLADETPGIVEDFIQRERRRHLLERSGDYDSCHGMGELSGLVLARTMELTGARNGYLFLSEEVDAPPVLAASRHLDDHDDDEYSANIVSRVFDTGEPVLTTNAELEREFSGFRSVSRYGLKSVLCMPVKHNDLLNGAVYLDNNLAAGVFNTGDMENLERLLSHAAMAIENLLLRDMLRLAGNEKKRPKRSRTDGVNLTAAMEYIRRNFANEVTREDIADDLGLSADYVGKLLKTHTGKTIREHLNEARVKKAMELMDDPAMKIIDIAMSVGFDSLRTFYRVFYRVAGMTPTEYREGK